MCYCCCSRQLFTFSSCIICHAGIKHLMRTVSWCFSKVDIWYLSSDSTKSVRVFVVYIFKNLSLSLYLSLLSLFPGPTAEVKKTQRGFGVFTWKSGFSRLYIKRERVLNLNTRTKSRKAETAPAVCVCGMSRRLFSLLTWQSTKVPIKIRWEQHPGSFVPRLSLSRALCFSLVSVWRAAQKDETRSKSVSPLGNLRRTIVWHTSHGSMHSMVELEKCKVTFV